MPAGRLFFSTSKRSGMPMFMSVAAVALGMAAQGAGFTASPPSRVSDAEAEVVVACGVVVEADADAAAGGASLLSHLHPPNDDARKPTRPKMMRRFFTVAPNTTRAARLPPAAPGSSPGPRVGDPSTRVPM